MSDGWVGMVFIGHWSSKSTFGANKWPRLSYCSETKFSQMTTHPRSDIATALNDQLTLKAPNNILKILMVVRVAYDFPLQSQGRLKVWGVVDAKSVT